MALAEEEPPVEKKDLRSSQWVEIVMKKVRKVLEMNDNDTRKHVLDYTLVDIHYVEEQRLNLFQNFATLQAELSECINEFLDLKLVKKQHMTLQIE
jgi:predicted component of type VI protein secretion system